LLSNRNIPYIAWNTLKKPDGGSIAAIGGTQSGWFGVIGNATFLGVPYLHVHFFTSYQPGTTPSAMLTKAKNNYLLYQWKDCLTLEEMELSGDPSLRTGGYSETSSE
jgi:hypothetical protein